jgi:hypothetical protein
VPQLQFSLDLIGLYETFTENKYNIYQTEKSKTPVSNVAAIKRRERELQTMRHDHHLLALKMLFNEEQVTLLQSNTQCILSDEEITMIGIVQISDDGKPHFIHRTFAEYYVAEFLVNQLTKGSNTSQQVQDLLLRKILVEEGYRVIRVFIDGLLSKSKPSQEVLKQYGNRISVLWGYSQTYHSVREGNAYIIGFLLESLQAGGHTDILHKLLLGEYFNIFVEAAGQPQVLQKLWEWGKETLTAEELGNKLLLAKDKWGQTAWHLAAKNGNIEILEKLWEWGKGTRTAEELCSNLLLAKDNMQHTAWHLAAKAANTAVLEKLNNWAKDAKINVIYELCVAKNNEGKTVLVLVQENGLITESEKLKAVELIKNCF